MKKCCRTCAYNKERTINSKNCLKGHRAVFGYGCFDYKSKNVDDIFKVISLGKFYN